MAYKGSFHMFGFKAAIKCMKASLDGLLEDDTEGDESISTSFKRGDNYVIDFTLEKTVDHVVGCGMLSTYAMKMEWKSSDPLFPYMPANDAFILALNACLHTDDQCIIMNLCDENVKHMFGKMKMALEAEMCVGCETNIVPKDFMECHTCMMGYTEQDDAKHMCGICHDTCQAKIEITPCCFQYIHRVCRKKWHGPCPFCRRAIV